ncbi:HIT family protein [Glycomyces luteolus]|uniref:HIT family protein n=1 Tax=Glycomyces luteolus TaxID=2670330 RepID=A0A9X3T4I2_9ACTN|nr:HIT family protein [Glycomyces luteolus]MDA1361120.1 HIT family protein [Glycomyces luteolus]
METSHEPPGYHCPFCNLLAGHSDGVANVEDIVHRDGHAAAFVSPRWWPNNRGHVLVVPTGHHENLYSIPADAYAAVGDLVREVAVAIRATYGCDGVSTRQHNEPSGNQDVWHLHVHVFPRYEGDRLYSSNPLPGWADAAERQVFAERLRSYFTSSSGFSIGAR